MKALDTNILVRYYLQDDARQGRIALTLMQEEPALWVAKTTVLELEWVLGSNETHPFPPDKISQGIDHLLRLPNVTVEDHEAVAAALRWYQQGLDFADALHLASARDCAELLTFDDRRFARRATRLRLKPPVTTPAAASP
jgi:predicted nucleic-acid-binding protein